MNVVWLSLGLFFLFMILGGINFALMYRAIVRRDPRAAARDQEGAAVWSNRRSSCGSSWALSPWRRRVFSRFVPESVIDDVATFDNARDPLAQQRLCEADFGTVTAEICRLAERLCGGRVVSTLEGGYDLQALGASAAAHLRALMNA